MFEHYAAYLAIVILIWITAKQFLPAREGEGIVAFRSAKGRSFAERKTTMKWLTKQLPLRRCRSAAAELQVLVGLGGDDAAAGRADRRARCAADTARPRRPACRAARFIVWAIASTPGGAAAEDADDRFQVSAVLLVEAEHVDAGHRQGGLGHVAA